MSVRRTWFRSSRRTLAGGVVLAAAGLLWSDPLAWRANPVALERPASWHASRTRPAVAWNAALSSLAPLATPPPPLASSAASSAYLHRAHEWLLGRFEDELASFARWDPPASPAVSVRILGESCTPPSVVEGLDAGASAERARREESVVESRVLALFPGLGAADLLRFHVHSEFEERYGPLGGVADCSAHGPLFGTPLPYALAWNGAEVLPSNHFVRREVTHREWLRKPTRFATTAVLDVAPGRAIYRWELLRDDAPADGAEVRFSAGVLFARDTPGGALLWHHSYYAGQSIPSALHSFASRRIEDSHREYLAVYARFAPEWCAEGTGGLQNAPELGR